MNRFRNTNPAIPLIWLIGISAFIYMISWFLAHPAACPGC